MLTFTECGEYSEDSNNSNLKVACRTEQQNIHVWNCLSPIVRSPALEATYQWERKAVIFTKWGILHFISSPREIQVSSTKIPKNLQRYRLVVIHLQSPPPLSPASPPHPKSSIHTSRFHTSHASFALHNLSFTLVPEPWWLEPPWIGGQKKQHNLSYFLFDQVDVQHFFKICFIRNTNLEHRLVDHFTKTILVDRNSDSEGISCNPLYFRTTTKFGGI